MATKWVDTGDLHAPVVSAQVSRKIGPPFLFCVFRGAFQGPGGRKSNFVRISAMKSTVNPSKMTYTGSWWLCYGSVVPILGSAILYHAFFVSEHTAQILLPCLLADDPGREPAVEPERSLPSTETSSTDLCSAAPPPTALPIWLKGLATT